MKPLEKIKARADFSLDFSDQQLVEMYNVERVRSYLEKNLGCTQHEVIGATGLNRRTVRKAIKIIRGQEPRMDDNEKREVVVDYATRTGQVCYPSNYRNKEGCLRCKRGPCSGPVEKYEEVIKKAE